MKTRTTNRLTAAVRPARQALKHAAIGLLRLRHALRQKPSEFVFINTVARSGSTLLSNILCSHPQICGFGETMTTYSSPADVSELVAQVCWGNRQLRVRERYVLEKIVLSYVLPNPEVLDDAAISWIYLLREPADSLRSNMEYHNRREAAALKYYLARLQRLASDARHYASRGHRALFLTHEQLVDETQSTLDAVSRFLGLSGGLSANYVRPRIRHGAAGDQSERIKAGQIIAERPDYHVELSSAALEQARSAHAECDAVLRRCCECVGERPADIAAS